MTTQRWRSPEFVDELRAFVTAALGEPPTTLEEVRLRPWSTVWRATTTSGVLYAKENCPGQRHEAALLRRLGEFGARHVVPLVAADEDRGLLLTPDLGPTLDDGGPVDVERWCALVRAGAELARDTAGRLDVAGLASIDPADAGDRLAVHADRLASLAADDPRHLSAADHARVTAALPTVRADAALLADLGLPLVLDHNDLHAANACLDADGEVVLFDLADAVLAHPLTLLRIPLANLAVDLGLEAAQPWRDPRVAPVVDAFADVWADVVPPARLLEAVPAALRIACLNRVESWARCLDSVSPPDLAEHGEAVPRWVRAAVE